MTPPREETPAGGASFAALAWRQFRRNRPALAALAIVALLTTVAVWCPLLATNQPLHVVAVFTEAYENDYYSALDVLGRLEQRAGESGADALQIAAPLPALLHSMAGSLSGESRTVIEACAAEATPIARAPAAASAKQLADLAARVKQAGDPATVKLHAREEWPAIRALRTGEVFALLLWFFAAAMGMLALWRRTRGGLSARAVRRLAAGGVALALLGAGLWRIALPPVFANTDWRTIIETPAAEGGPARLTLAPVPYGENENLTEDANLPPTWTLRADDPTARRSPKNRPHWLGTDASGRDVTARMIYGARVSMLIGVVAVAIYLSIGVLVGAAAGYFGGWIDMLLSRIVEIVICFPTLFLLLILLAYIRPDIYTIMAAIGLISWTGIARLERAEFLRLRNEDFVMAVRALGGGSARIIFRHILPNALGPVLVAASFGVAGSILAESTLSFLGFGVPPHVASWGELLKGGNERIRDSWWLVLFPGIALFTTVTCFNLLGEGIRDATDPRIRKAS